MSQEFGQDETLGTDLPDLTSGTDVSPTSDESVNLHDLESQPLFGANHSPCYHCSGTGVSGGSACWYCSGTGVQSK